MRNQKRNEFGFAVANNFGDYQSVETLSSHDNMVLFFAKVLTFIVRIFTLIWSTTKNIFQILWEFATTIRTNAKVYAYFKVFMVAMIIIWYYEYKDKLPHFSQNNNPQKIATMSLLPISFDFTSNETEDIIQNDVVNRNEAAPAAIKSLKVIDVNTFIERFKMVAKTESEIYHIPASIILAQGIIESHTGNSKLAKNNNNFFGIKCFSKNCPEGHCTNHNDDHHKDFFRKYQNPWYSFRAHSQMLTNGKYKTLCSNSNDYKKWAKGLKKLGYATDKTYDKKIVAIIEQYNLSDLD
jgi:flagellum-specific peptidoglycan hydrolase FlgJ